MTISEMRTVAFSRSDRQARALPGLVGALEVPARNGLDIMFAGGNTCTRALVLSVVSTIRPTKDR